MTLENCNFFNRHYSFKKIIPLHWMLWYADLIDDDLSAVAFLHKSDIIDFEEWVYKNYNLTSQTLSYDAHGGDYSTVTVTFDSEDDEMMFLIASF